MDYRYVDQQAAAAAAAVVHRPGASHSHEDQGQQGQQPPLNHHQPQHLQHLPTHFAHQHGLQSHSLPHQHMHHVAQPVLVAAPHSREAYSNNRRQTGQDLQSFLEVSGLVPVRPPTQLQQHQHPQQDSQRQQPRSQENRAPSMQLLPDSQLLNSNSQRSYNSNLSSSVPPPAPQQQPQDYRRDYAQQPEMQASSSAAGPARQQDSSLLQMIDAPQHQLHQQVRHSPTRLDREEEEVDGDLEPLPARVLLKERHRPGPLPPNTTPPKLPEGLVYTYASGDKKKVVGVKAEKMLEKGTQYGPFQGALVDEAAGCVEESSWELCLQGRILYYVDGKYRRNENWMLHVPCARTREEQNLEAVQLYGFIHFQVTKVIKPGSELRVFYSADYASHVGFKMNLDDLKYNKEADNFQCQQCQCLYKSAKRMSRHIKLAHEQERAGRHRPRFTWEMKKKATETRQPVVQQERSAENNRFICVTCGKDFPTRGRLAAHETFHDFIGNVYLCEHCGDAFESSQTLAKHVLSHETHPFKCAECGKLFFSKSSLCRHRREAHTPRQDKYRCILCDLEFDDAAELDKHEQCHNDNHAETDGGENVDNSAKDAGTAHSRAAELEGDGSGSQQKSKEKEQVAQSNSTFPVDMLGKRISYFDRPRPYKCHYCSSRFRQYNQRKYHEQEVHEGKGTYQCPQCVQRFVTRCNLEAHMKKHNPIRPFLCQLCPRSFASQKALVNHQGEHTGLKPFKCTVCSRGFRTQKLMGKHRSRMHGKREKRFACSFCDKRFMERSSWRNHERRHKGIRPFVCLVCGKGFSSKDSMAVHQRVHTGEMPFQCEKCSKRFRNNHNLTAHLLQHAKDDVSG
ncbi:uncharacterized protein [Diadema setosum]|uniref:uncharacterized protein n=1 Tax=Diadema setosum TaxID=31175 RepID=UPI003B3B1C5D